MRSGPGSKGFGLEQHILRQNGSCLLLMDTELAAGESQGGNLAPILNYYIFSGHFPEAHIAQIELVRLWCLLGSVSG